eukprot:scaffold48_cov395-Prasinococcus_capsulatus_cf.AAC.7
MMRFELHLIACTPKSNTCAQSRHAGPCASQLMRGMFQCMGDVMDVILLPLKYQLTWATGKNRTRTAKLSCTPGKGAKRN